jgi:DNA-directed RNA polymerase sigma subunit (sigma70/sigma32)
MKQIDVSEEITQETRRAARNAMVGVAVVVNRARAKGRLRKAPLRFVVGIVNSTAETTMEFMDLDPWNAKNYCRAGFDAVWRVLE